MSIKRHHKLPNVNRRFDLDILKGLAIIAVILYHVGILPYGYLGVDVFLIISGFLTIPIIINKIAFSEFSYFEWFWKRIKRFLPLVIIVCAVSLFIGYFTMMPDDYENLAQSAFASEIFCNNILQAITTGNYWDNANDFKPLLPLWYLGLVVQFFLVFPIILLLIKVILSKNKNPRLLLIKSTAYIAILSFTLYLFWPINFNLKFYYLPFRIWEFCIGALIFFIFKNEIKVTKFTYYILLLLTVTIFCVFPNSFNNINKITIIGSHEIITSNSYLKVFLLISIVILTVSLISLKINLWKGFLPIAFIGKMSLSLFIWHQLILAFVRYTLSDTIKLPIFIGYLITTFIISFISFYYIEKIKLRTFKSKITISICWLCVLCVSYFIYFRAGVFRDIPEMGVTYENPYAVRNTEYIDRIYNLDLPFLSDKTKVLIIGNSFARDFACCLEEWEGSKNIEISYMFEPKDGDSRYKDADFIFIFGSKADVPAYIWNSITDSTKIFGIGTKSFGKSFGNVYSHRNSSEYYKSSFPIPDELSDINSKWKKSWGKNYIDFVSSSLNENGDIRLFTPDSMIISFDCRHLSPAGAKFFSDQFNFDDIFNIKE